MPPDESTQNLKTDVDHMTAILDAYFNFINTTESEEPTMTNITDAVYTLVERHQQPEHKIDIKSTIDKPVMLRKNGFLRCVLNLLSNAARYGNHVHITLATIDTKQGKFIQCIIEDNGVGVLETHYEKIFDPFFSDNLSRTLSQNHGERIGLGLSIARNIARTKGGDITPDSSERLGGLKMTLVYAIDT
jgi:two-component system osmolarity sensor histidine kinase EnvZ